jgi:predicted aspartyl protease
MSTPFNSRSGLIVVSAIVEGPAGKVQYSLAVDTGAKGTVISDAVLIMAGIDPSLAQQRIQVTTASAVVFAPRMPIPRLFALGQDRIAFPIIALTVPPGASVEGLLGLDFYRGQTLNIDFRTGCIDLT